MMFKRIDPDVNHVILSFHLQNFLSLGNSDHETTKDIYLDTKF